MEFLDKLNEIISIIDQAESSSILEAAEICAATIAVGRAVVIFGAGHSALPAQEAFPRIGSIVGFVQITEPNLGFNGHVTGKGGQRQMSYLEQTSGYAEVILSNYDLTPEDAMIVISNSGINALPVELCDLANQNGLTTIGISSSAHSVANKPKNKLGKRLLEIADLHIDNHIPAGDTLVTLGEDTHIGGGSTIASMAIINSVIVETIRLLHQQGVQFHLYPSHNVSSDIEKVERQEEELFKAHKKLIAKL